jgi:hypothetical protein
MTLNARLALPYGLVAQILTSDEDRPPPEDLTRQRHVEHSANYCGCELCKAERHHRARVTAEHQA